MDLTLTARLGYIEKAINIYSRRGAGYAKEETNTLLPLQKTHVTSAFSAPLRENSMLNLQHRLVSANTRTDNIIRPPSCNIRASNHLHQILPLPI